MAKERSPEMIRVAYYFGRYDAMRTDTDSPVPPELASLGVSTQAEAIELFRTAVGDGRTEVTFRRSLKGDSLYIANTLREGQPLGESRRGPIGRLLFATDAELWEAIRGHIEQSLLSTGS